MGSHGALASLFGPQSHAYALFRPSYPPELFQRILSFAGLEQPEARRLAVDLGCGSGQATVDLAPLFDRVVGVDASAEQLGHTPHLPNAEFRCLPVEATGLPGGCADLVTAAASLHWCARLAGQVVAGLGGLLCGSAACLQRCLPSSAPFPLACSSPPCSLPTCCTPLSCLYTPN